MSLRRFAGSAAGRIANATLSLALLAAAGLAFAGPGPHIHIAIPLVILFCGVGAIFSIGLAVQEHGSEAFALIAGLPLLTGPYLAGLFLASSAGPGIGAVLLMASLVPVWTAAIGYRVVARRATSADAQPRQTAQAA